MTDDGDALFRAIREHPEEDTPRLVYADWLQESGQPERAEFIRLQCEAWALCPAYPTLAAARTRASDLLKAFGDRWYEELPALPGVEWGSLFVRGFVDTVRTSWIEDLPRTLDLAFAATPLRHVSVEGLRHGQLRQLLDSPYLARLKSLDLPGILGVREARLLNAARARFPHVEIG
jgi:uncharacterized protein (TIGR02996 family)